ncbi:Single-stranded DNA-binding protein [Trichuris trichiura]|uniref:Single-stranded DNA-binding protein n=1 Tax=Trichuris trichiura TaxID=36087 RepID=A0A077Z6I0_TRITR|nr:Single-stranded DNA-binding protein [Trichuris trichiura]
MAMARLAVSLPCNAAEAGESTFWLGVIAFGKQADALAKHQKGDLVSVAGNMQLNQWTGQDGGTQQGYQVVADSVISARTVRPGGKAGQRGQAAEDAEQRRATFDRKRAELSVMEMAYWQAFSPVVDRITGVIERNAGKAARGIGLTL